MRRILTAGIGLAAIAAGAAIAQTRGDDGANQRPAELTAEEQKAADARPDPAAIQAELQQKARRIPARDLAAALRAAKDDRSDRAITLERAPDKAALREALSRTEAEDKEAGAARPQLSARSLAAAPPVQKPAPGIRAMRAENLKSADAREVSAVRAPVLLPADPALRDKLRVYGMTNIYTAAAPLDANASFSMTGTCNRVIGGDPETAAFRKRLAARTERLAGVNASYQISRNDFGVDLSFAKFGCGYVMTIECTAPASDARCAGDDYVTGLAQSLILANPELAESE